MADMGSALPVKKDARMIIENGYRFKFDAIPGHANFQLSLKRSPVAASNRWIASRLGANHSGWSLCALIRPLNCTCRR
ncbi:hypothetical protein D3C85_1872970 [compost metagenome]